jgi:hypothetical protein
MPAQVKLLARHGTPPWIMASEKARLSLREPKRF